MVLSAAFLILYSLLLYILALPIWLYFFWRSVKDPAYRRRLGERLGNLPESIEAGSIVVHTVSVGEVIAATPFIRQLQQAWPDQRITVTCTTPTGSATIRQRFASSIQPDASTQHSAAIQHCYLPLDFPGSVSRFLRQTQPKALIIMETELWPNLLAQADQAGIPVVVINARLSARSARGYRRFACLTKPLLQHIHLLLTQDKATARRFRALGYQRAPEVTGNLKFELSMPDNQQALLNDFQPVFADRLLWVAGSTHAGEDEALLQIFPRLKAQFPNLLLMLVPRHPERFDKVATLVTNAGLALWRRSSETMPTADVDIALGDSMGELLAWYQLADVAFIGGSLIERGGHNPLEAICFGKAVQTGPHTFNFADAYRQLQQYQAVSLVANANELADNTAALLADSKARQEQGERAKHFFLQQQGATARTLVAIQQLIRADQR